jgi:hypothetical protein
LNPAADTLPAGDFDLSAVFFLVEADCAPFQGDPGIYRAIARHGSQTDAAAVNATTYVDALCGIGLVPEGPSGLLFVDGMTAHGLDSFWLSD